MDHIKRTFQQKFRRTKSLGINFCCTVLCSGTSPLALGWFNRLIDKKSPFNVVVYVRLKTQSIQCVIARYMVHFQAAVFSIISGNVPRLGVYLQSCVLNRKPFYVRINVKTRTDSTLLSYTHSSPVQFYFWYFINPCERVTCAVFDLLTIIYAKQSGVFVSGTKCSTVKTDAKCFSC